MDRNDKITVCVVAAIVIAVIIAITAIIVVPNNFNEKQYMDDLQFTTYEKYFYGVDYSKVGYDYEYGFEYCKQHFGPKSDVDLPGCSAVSYGNMFGRNYDWCYDETPVFLVRTAATDGKHATLGMATFAKGVSDDDVKDGKYTDRYKDLVFCTLDGMNDAGLVACMNVSSIYEERTTGTNPGAKDMSIIMCVRYILDHASNLNDVKEELNSFNIFSPNCETMNQEFHILVTDASGESMVVEFVGNSIQYLMGEYIATNFDLTCFYDEETEQCIMDVEDRVHYKRIKGNDVFDLIPYKPYGIERYVTLLSNLDDKCGTDYNAMFGLMKKVYYSNAYTNREKVWYSEAYRDDVDKFSPISDVEKLLNEHRALYERHIRDGMVWQTVHCCVYDMKTMTVHIAVQESQELGYEFTLSV